MCKDKSRACWHAGVINLRAQDDVESADGPRSRSAPHGRSVARTYTYETERACDAHLGTFLTSIQAAGKAPGQGFAAIKVPRRLRSMRRKMQMHMLSMFDHVQACFVQLGAPAIMLWSICWHM